MKPSAARSRSTDQRQGRQLLGRPVRAHRRGSTSGDAASRCRRRASDREARVRLPARQRELTLALAMAPVSNEKGVLRIVPGGHTDTITGSSCHSNVFRVCDTTQIEADAVASALVKEFGRVLLRHARLRLSPHAGDRPHQGGRRARRREGRGRPRPARRRRLLPLISSRRRRPNRTSSSSSPRATIC